MASGCLLHDVPVPSAMSLALQVVAPRASAVLFGLIFSAPITRLTDFLILLPAGISGNMEAPADCIESTNCLTMPPIGLKSNQTKALHLQRIAILQHYSFHF